MANKPPIVVFGAGGHALVVADIIQLLGQYHIAGFLDDVNHERHGSEFSGAKILGGSGVLPDLQADGVKHAIVAVGQSAAREKIAKHLVQMGFVLVNAIHPRACVAHATVMGPGCVVAAQAVINPGSRIGANVIVNTGATVDHECLIGEAAHICPGVHLAGHVVVGEHSWIGIGSTLSDHIHIGSNVIIGAGSVVVRDIPSGMVAYGVPARVIRKVSI